MNAIRIPWLFIVITCCFWWVPAKAADIIQVTPQGVRSEKIMELRLRPFENCALLMAGVEGIVNSASQQFLRRGWSPEFLKERVQLAREFSARSWNYGVQSGESDDFNYGLSTDAESVATIAVTAARYSSKNQFSEDLPMERSLKMSPLPRPETASGDGIIFEARTYSKAKKDGISLYPLILDYLITTISRELKGNLELYDKPIVYLYGDEVSLRLYSLFGFKMRTDIPPVEHEGTLWWTMTISPKDLESQFYGNKMLEVQVPTHLPMPDRLRPVILSQPTELAPGIVGGPGSTIVGVRGKWNWHLRLWKAAVINGVTVPAGTDISFVAGRAEAFCNLTKAIEIKPGLILPAGTAAHLTAGGNWEATVI